MIVAIPVWQGRVSPVLDVAEHLLLVQLEGWHEVARREATGLEQHPHRRARQLAELGVTTVVCGAVSRPLEQLLCAQHIQVISHVCGDVDEVVRAYCSGSLSDDRFAMPGCCRSRQRRARRCGPGRRARGRRNRRNRLDRGQVEQAD